MGLSRSWLCGWKSLCPIGTGFGPLCSVFSKISYRFIWLLFGFAFTKIKAYSVAQAGLRVMCSPGWPQTCSAHVASAHKCWDYSERCHARIDQDVWPNENISDGCMTGLTNEQTTGCHRCLTSLFCLFPAGTGTQQSGCCSSSQVFRASLCPRPWVWIYDSVRVFV